MTGPGKKKDYRLCIILSSGAYEKVHEAMGIASVALARGGEVHVLFTYGAIGRLVKGMTDLVEMEGAPTPFAERFKKHVERGSIETISSMMRAGKQFGALSIYACSAAMAILSVSHDDLIPEVDSVTGLVRFMDLVRDADTTLYI